MSFQNSASVKKVNSLSNESAKIAKDAKKIANLLGGTAPSSGTSGAGPAITVSGPPRISGPSPAAAKRARRRVKRNLQNRDMSGLVSSYERIASSLAVPALNDPERWSSEFSTAPTAIASPWAQTVAGWNIAGNSTINIPNTDMFGFVFRSAERAAILYDANSSAQTMTYAVYGSSPGGDEILTLPSSSWSIFNGGTGVALNVPETLHTPYALATSTYRPHGTTLFAGADGVSTSRYFWLDGHTTMSITYTTVATQVPVFIADIWTPDGVSQGNYTVAGSTGTSQTTTLKTNAYPAGYYAFRVFQTVATGVLSILSMTIQDVGGPICCHRCIPGYDVNVGSVTGIRVLAAALMYTNEAALINKQGKIAGFQSPQGTHWTDYVKSGGAFSNVASAQGSVTLTVDNGMYGFLKPTKPSDFDVQTYIEVDSGNLVDSFYPLDHQSAFLVLYTTISITGGQDGYWTASYGVEYQTSDVWREIGFPECEKSVYDRALESLKYLPQFHENPLHISDIWDTIKNSASAMLDGVVKYGPTVATLATTLAPLFI